MARRDIIVVGASAGGVQALAELAKNLPEDFPAALFIVLHLGSGRSSLPEILNRAGSLPALHPEPGEPVVPGRIYAAPPDLHMVLRNGAVGLLRGPKENGFRPAIDVLFRTAARAYRNRVVGVVLTGNLDDGTAGLLAIKRLGGIAVVQDPADADHPAMPRSALENVDVDHVAPLAELPGLLVDLAGQEVEPLPPYRPAEEDGDVSDEKVGQSGEETRGAPSGFTCPDCGGALWEWSDGDLLRYRCRIGHAYSPESLVATQTESMEHALWAAVRALEETAAIARRMAHRMRDSGLHTSERRFQERAREAEAHAATLSGILETRSVDEVEVEVAES